MEHSVESFLRILFLPITKIVMVTDRLGLPYLLSSLLLAFLVYAFTQRYSIVRFFKFCFPKKVYLHPSAILDYKFYYVNTFVQAFFPLSLTIWLSASFSQVLQDFFFGFGIKPVFAFAPFHWLGPLLFSIFYTLALAVAFDFGLFFSHYLLHKLPWLWEFHKVHHSAESLTPVTVHRMHPMDDFITYCFVALFTSIVDAVLRVFIAGPVAEINIYSTNLMFFLFYFFGYHARHSHVWIDYGKNWDNILISPAQHQIHHSTKRQHWDKNLGFIVAFWDRLFGTLYVPAEKEEISFGLNEEGEHKHYSSMTRLYFLPFVRNLRYLGTRPHVLNLCLLLIVPVITSPLIASALDKAKPNVFMEDMTSQEVKDLIAHGYIRAIVPTGGVEQNGAHMVLGKHNYIIKATSEKIAIRAGHTLVAPPIPYSACGNICPPTGHMRFTGSISLTDDAFASVLECVARSLKQSGFKEIYFLGDHGPSQKIQNDVATKLSAEWQNDQTKDPVKVVNLSNYYLENGQYMSFRLQGWDAKKIGTHAGIRDTAEMMAVHPQGVREKLMKAGTLNDGSGVDGDPTGATPLIGQQMLEMKIRAAVQQILSPSQTATKFTAPPKSGSES
jgi:sterol desaturase/sphingolipid hydroxylase (fatty acid hydroxylase superfamily)/creatinine amidohydrolase/Fe(II)-dependent formamide hydrolase-like protein